MGETLNINGGVLGHLHDNCCDTICALFPCSSASVRYENAQLQLKYEKACSFMSVCGCCPWKAFWNDQVVGYVSMPGCCDNGCCFLCCPYCVCSGDMALVYLQNAYHQDTHSLRSNLFCCWPSIMMIGQWFGLCLLPWVNGCQWCCNNNYVVTRELVWPAGQRGSLTSEVGWQPIGEYFMQEHIAFLPPFFCYRKPTKFGVKVYNKATPDSVLVQLMLLPRLWAGLPETPYRLCLSAPVAPPRGSCCADMGRYAQVDFGSKRETEQVLEKDLRVDLGISAPEPTVVYVNHASPSAMAAPIAYVPPGQPQSLPAIGVPPGPLTQEMTARGPSTDKSPLSSPLLFSSQKKPPTAKPNQHQLIDHSHMTAE